MHIAGVTGWPASWAAEPGAKATLIIGSAPPERNQVVPVQKEQEVAVKGKLYLQMLQGVRTLLQGSVSAGEKLRSRAE